MSICQNARKRSVSDFFDRAGTSAYPDPQKRSSGLSCAMTSKARIADLLTRKTVPSEHAEQVAFVHWFRLQHPTALIFAIPNGGNRNIVTAGKLKAEGVTPGVPDLFIPGWRMFIEMKRRKGGRVTPEQKRVMAHLVGCGYRCIVAKGCEDAIKQINRVQPPVQTQSQEDDWWARVDAEIENVCAELEGLRDE